MSTLSWSPAPRPNGGTVDVMGARCRCGRAVYVDVRNLPGQPSYREDLDCWRCRGCDEDAAAHCYCPSAKVTA